MLFPNSPFGQVVGRVSATDVDLGRNAELTYKFTTKNELFAIDEQTGFISSIKVIDRETLSQTTFDLKVIVSDLGLVPQNAIGKKHALKKYDQFTLNTSLFWGNTGSNITPVVQFHEIFITKIMNKLIYYYC